jgi:hypothetical protein
MPIHELGIAENTFVMYSTDNGPHINFWPDGGMTPFRAPLDQLGSLLEIIGLHGGAGDFRPAHGSRWIANQDLIACARALFKIACIWRTVQGAKPHRPSCAHSLARWSRPPISVRVSACQLDRAQQGPMFLWHICV